MSALFCPPPPLFFVPSLFRGRSSFALLLAGLVRLGAYMAAGALLPSIPGRRSRNEKSFAALSMARTATRKCKEFRPVILLSRPRAD